MAALLSWVWTLGGSSRFVEPESVTDDDETLVYGQATANLMEAYRAKTGSSDARRPLLVDDIVDALKRIQIEPSRVQVRDMLRFAAECRTTESDRRKHLTFGELCLFAVDLSAGLYDRYWTYGQKSTTFEERKERNRRRASSSVKYQVFLGGSCNPTTWRQDIVIPILKEEGVSFYNPQVETWHPDLIEIEEKAKDAAEAFFFVIDNQTRAIASMVEVAYLSASGKPIILTLIDYPETITIDGTVLEDGELQDLVRGRIFLCSLMAHRGLPVFNDIAKAARACCQVIKHNVPITSFGLKDGAQPARMAGVSVGKTLVAARETFRHCSASQTNFISTIEARLALKSLCQVDDEDDWDCYYVRIPEKKSRFSFNEFCCLAAETLLQKNNRNWFLTITEGISSSLARLFNSLLKWLQRAEVRREYSRDVFLGGSCGTTTWRKETSIPMLQGHGISFYNPQVEHWNVRFLPVEAQAKESCRLLLYVIGSNSLSVASLVEAASFIGEGRSIVLCLNNIADGTEINGVLIAGRAARDYNRGRSYTAQYANQNNVSVFESAREATQCVIARVKGRPAVERIDSAMKAMKRSIPSLPQIDEFQKQQQQQQ
ncbi:uncharacterized protein [Oscarella lobularis]|uniref:uncharacterized protein n=1 Tax=Oscarella lobularis TaxID=121494 RepID=UPI00331447FA